MAIQSSESQIDGFRTVTIEGQSVLLTVIPEIGGKIISFQNTNANREYIWRDPVRSIQDARIRRMVWRLQHQRLG